MPAPEKARADRRQSFGNPHPPRTRDRRARPLVADFGSPRHQLARHVIAVSKIRSHRRARIDAPIATHAAVT
jgi:hypothetical protein